MPQSFLSIRVYSGAEHPSAQGKRVVVLGAWRNFIAVSDDELRGDLRPSDTVEFAEIVGERGASVRVAWVTLLGCARELGPVSGWFEGEIPDGVVRLDPKQSA